MSLTRPSASLCSYRRMDAILDDGLGRRDVALAAPRTDPGGGSPRPTTTEGVEEGGALVHLPDE